MLAEIRLRINDPKLTFNPEDYKPQRIRERTLEHQITLWIEQKSEETQAGELSPETLKDYRGYCKNYLIPMLGDYDVREIKYEQLEEFKDKLPKKLKLKTRRNILNALHTAFIRMHKKGIIQEFPAWPTIEGNDSSEREAISYSQQAVALQKIPSDERGPTEFGFETGLRPGETCALKVKDIDVEHKRALIQRTWSGSKLRETTKGKNKRWIPLSDRAWEILASSIKNKLPEAFLFINPRTGKPYRQKTLNNLWRKYSGHSIDFYSASRHSFCTQLVHNGASQFEAQALMRHADLRSTQKYFHADAERLRDHVNRRGRENVVNAHFKQSSNGSN